MITGMHHITLRVSNLERSRAFYEGVLGFPLDQDFPGEKLRFRIPGTSTRLVLRPPLPGTPDGDRFSERRIGLDHLAVGVTDRAELDRLVEALRDNGYETEGVRLVRAFRDPDNIQWEYFEQSPGTN